MRVNLTLGKQKMTYKVHRLVALSFVPRIEGKAQVNHIDENKANNKASNLEWVTQKENNNHGRHNRVMQKTKGTPVVQYSGTDEVIAYYVSIKEAARITAISEWKIAQAVKNGGGTAGGYYWNKGCK